MCFRELAFEKAYCEYRLNKVADAYQTIQGAAESTPRELELKAQILYRLEKYVMCAYVLVGLQILFYLLGVDYFWCCNVQEVYYCN